MKKDSLLITKRQKEMNPKMHSDGNFADLDIRVDIYIMIEEIGRPGFPLYF